MAKKDLILFDEIAELLTLEGVARKKGRHVQEEDLGIVAKAALIIEKGCVAWAGPRSRIPRDLKSRIAKKVSLKDKTVLPGFVECHTHLVFAGNRADEFEMKNRGATYQEIAARGGGILSTVKATRAASPAELQKLAQRRADEFVRQGVTTLEAKSGYALNEKDELKILGIHQKINGPRIVSTFMGAHAKPEEFKTVPEYLKFLEGLLPGVKKKKLATRVDAFIEKGFFDAELTRGFLKKARELGFSLSIHADQLTLSGGTDLAIELGASSADHVIQVSDDEIRKLATHEITAVALPAADLYMKCAYPPARKMIDTGVRVALATDFNPGTSPTQDLSLVGLLARLRMQMTLPEVVAAMTFNAACALELQDLTGSLEKGKSADFAVVDGSWRELFYSIGSHPIEATYLCGKKLTS